jgi:hypothetical protein
METIDVSVTKQMGGFVFALRPRMQRELLKAFPKLSPIDAIYVSFDTQKGVSALSPRLELHIFPALLGMIDKNDLHGEVKNVRFLESATDEYLYGLKL